jgi:hypothetical protein
MTKQSRIVNKFLSIFNRVQQFQVTFELFYEKIKKSKKHPETYEIFDENWW